MKNHMTKLGGLYLIFGIISAVVALFFYRSASQHGPILGVVSLLSSIPGFRSVLTFA